MAPAARLAQRRSGASDRREDGLRFGRRWHSAQAQAGPVCARPLLRLYRAAAQRRRAHRVTPGAGVIRVRLSSPRPQHSVLRPSAMMPTAAIPGGGAVSRPFIFAVVLVLLFLSARTVRRMKPRIASRCCVARGVADAPRGLRARCCNQDIENPERKLEAAAERGSEKRSAALKEHDAVSEKARVRAHAAAARTGS